MPKLFKEPLLHFLVAGALLFALYGRLNPDTAGPDNQRIEITPGVIQDLEEAWTRQWRRPPEPEELAGLIEAYIREEVFYREAISLGLDQDDTIIRRRLAQKMEYLTEDLSIQAEPTDSDLRTFFTNRREDFTQAARISFRHIYFSPDKRGANARGDAQLALATLLSADTVDIGERGDAFLMQSEYLGLTQRDTSQLFGTEFGTAIFELRSDGWQGPIKSGFGWHLVWINEKQAAQIPDFNAVRDQVRLEYDYEQQRRARETVFRDLRRRYDIVKLPADSGS
ncbi:MAG: peptidyl-prolyl cis-trans isomerase [Gammaproteobacteria bacterium]